MGLTLPGRSTRGPAATPGPHRLPDQRYVVWSCSAAVGEGRQPLALAKKQREPPPPRPANRQPRPRLTEGMKEVGSMSKLASPSSFASVVGQAFTVGRPARSAATRPGNPGDSGAPCDGRSSRWVAGAYALRKSVVYCQTSGCWAAACPSQARAPRRGKAPRSAYRAGQRASFLPYASHSRLSTHSHPSHLHRLRDGGSERVRMHEGPRVGGLVTLSTRWRAKRRCDIRCSVCFRWQGAGAVNGRGQGARLPDLPAGIPLSAIRAHTDSETRKSAHPNTSRPAFRDPGVGNGREGRRPTARAPLGPLSPFVLLS